MINYEALFKISYGLYVVCSGTKENGNGYISNTVFQVTSDPPRFATCCNKDNHTAGLIQSSGQFSVSVLHEDAGAGTIGTFGYKSGKDANKLDGMDVRYGETGVPILQDCLAYLECVLRARHEPGNHTLYIGEVVDAALLSAEEPMSTLDYAGFYVGKE